MKLTEFDYDLPEGLIAQEPCQERDRSRMLVVRRQANAFTEERFQAFPDYLEKGDVLVVNDSKVIRARLSGRKASGGVMEILLLSRPDRGDDTLWDVLLRPAKRARVGTVIFFDHENRAILAKRITEKKWRLRFETGGPIDQFLEKYGSAPLPPYIKREKSPVAVESDLERYQTVYAISPGSVAAPTAGLHFTGHILDRLKDKGISVVSVTLHVGYGTFMPVEKEEVEDHVMDEEFYEVTEEAATMINQARRVVAVGTTATRVIESLAGADGKVTAGSGWTRLFIYPGFRFRRVDALLTNFHLPRSSLFLLVCAFAGKDLIKAAYRRSIEDRFRFYSYGDCMLIL